ncbi:hypothetical protein OIU84_014740 [Salix udensis]|uniref:DUF3741 domain-containing protein n=1 Tax=Salix udensis TaxID=889485 RepID=A0AAD6JEF0_9ROSI|nr:hypothetical protein OIU84_014740 [Salix udensis]
MNETTGNPAGTCLALTEKKAHRPGGCAGIFFQLFDWNRRFAKKKLFSRKLLPAARAKQPSKKFGGDEKMPKTKLHLIVDENKGGFPNVKKSGNCNNDIVVKKHEMRAPSLVAKLMGLDSLPTVHRDKHKKVSNSVACDVTEEKLVNNSHSESDRNDLKMEKRSAKVESRPQKLQKTGQFERQALTRFGADVFQINSALSRSRRHHHPKLAPPFKSPRISSSKNASRTSRLIDAATRILEPGLHATSRSKSALTYPSSMNSCLRDEVSAEEIGIMLPNIVKQQDIGHCNEGEGMSFTGQTSCKNCGNLFDVVDSRPNVKERQFVCPSTPSYYMSSQESEMIKPRPPISTPEQERNLSNPVSPESQSQRQLRSQQCRPQQQERASSAAYGINEARDSVALNRNIISRGRTRASNLAENSTIDKDRKVRKRTVGFNAQVEGTGFPNPMSVRQRNTRSDSVSRKVAPSSSRTIDRACIKTGSVNDGESNKNNGSRENDAISLTFNSPLRHRTFVSKGGLNERSHQIDKNTSHQRRLVLDENDGKTPLQNRFPLRGGALGTILEQKLKELASQEQEELTSGGSHPMRSAAMILQELIFALTEDQPMSPHAHMFNADKTYQEEGKIRRNSVGISADGAHLSPGSVLEASFSNDSCLSSSLDDSSGRRMLLDSMDCSYDQPQPVDTDADLLDCASSLIQGRTGSKMATDLLNHVSRILQSINLAGAGLAGNKLTHAKEVILNAELLFGSATLSHSDRTKRFLVGPFLLDGLETLAGAMLKNLNCSLGFEEDEGNQLGKFLFDCVIECLDSNYIGYINTGFKTWKRVPPSCMNTKKFD